MTKPVPMDHHKKSVIWREWERGTPMANIARIIDKPPASVFSYLQYHEDIRPRHHFRRAEALSLEEREEISRGISHGYSIRFIANALCRSPSTISREINKTVDRRYIVPSLLINLPGVASDDQSLFYRTNIRHWRTLLVAGCVKTGLLSKSQDGSNWRILTPKACMCRMRRFSKANSCKHAGCSERSCATISEEA